ncbi:ABC transporter ATP-binding protein [Streptomyces caniscabiei]|uniref:ABC transporter ATP-binding protein n=1 Tax=Streptomyces caniscabiei TaxID=2746961 RepID=A0ABU4N038_9ACTN|nr:ABC transporter ATP-binding protein [Streptomyces caniscabiei]MDX2948241.1 ABC transporter ATP-binding protein [Streptomyces caniscabiei]MDX2957215.1 ABC transporter ATP-binding protein [Streptomyces caniscabiei]MDX2990906.1 ABC transporter ATP-binding protein [Streptomyces caniscabiei]MDX3015453.1 ABC transporter ATP-binding protein [Streptomyces caniscabiei]MDX3043141.1 ABC transporter ATP-binding protein [Streptomyces caniscabiei]
MSVPAVRFRDIVKTYGSTTAVDGLNLDIPSGTCFGLLGPNGAGKSTTMRLITGQSRATSGTVEVLGHRMPEDSRRVRSLIGVVPQQDDADVELTVRQNLDVFARFSGLPRRRYRDAVDRALAAVRLTDRADSRVEALSGGMRRRLLLARGFLTAPRVLLLDEPTVGLDPQARQDLWGVIETLRAEGTTVIMSTHYIEEAERLADEVAIVFAGRVIARAAPERLLRDHAGAQAAEYRGDAARRTLVEKQAVGAGLPSRRTGLSVSVLRAETMPSDLRASLGPPDVVRPTTLEDVFVLLTGELFT